LAHPTCLVPNKYEGRLSPLPEISQSTALAVGALAKDTLGLTIVIGSTITINDNLDKGRHIDIKSGIGINIFQ
jgi:hypothetical protein